MKILVATKNSKKMAELKELLSELDIEVVSLLDFDNVSDVAEDGVTFQDNAIKKACETANITGMLTIADDSGLEIDALDGAPGVFSARFAGTGKDEDNINKVLSLLKDVPAEKRQARFKCSIAIANKDGLIDTAEGVCEGEISFEVRGKYGFGYDPVFIIPEYNKTFAELGPEIKQKISHRAKALQKAKEIILKLKMKRSNLP